MKKTYCIFLILVLSVLNKLYIFRDFSAYYDITVNIVESEKFRNNNISEKLLQMLLKSHLMRNAPCQIFLHPFTFLITAP